MHVVHSFIEGSLPAAWVVLVLAFALLAKCAYMFVDSAVGLAARFKIPKLVIGIVLVSLATTAPELSVSLTAALRGQPEMALGNAIGSIICNTGLALAFCAVLSRAPVPVIPHVLKTSGGFLFSVAVLCFVFVALDYRLARWEGLLLIALFWGYMGFLFRQHRGGRLNDDAGIEGPQIRRQMSGPWLFLLLAAGLGGIVLASVFIITSAVTIARSFGIPEAVIALTLVALGTSIPEAATCVAAARKNEGALAVGNILGANIMNVCWVAGASAIANPLVLTAKETCFMFPAMFVILGTSLLMLGAKYRLSRRQGVILFGLYVLYLASFFFLFPPQR